MPTGGPSWQDIYDVGRAALQARRPRFIVRPGDATDAVLCGGATMANIIIGAGAKGFRNTLIDGAEGDDLTVRCRDSSVERDQGDAATGIVSFTRAAPGAGGTIPAGTRVASAQDPITGAFATFTTNTALVFNAADLSKSVAVTCTQIGSLGNVGAAQVNRILDTLFSSAFTATNSVTMAGGTEREEDPDLRTRTKLFPQTLSKGTVDALLYGAKLVDGVKRASIVVDETTGVINLYVSDANGNSNQALADAVSLAFVNDWRGAGDIVNVIAATLYTVDVSITLTVKAGVDVNAIIDLVSQAIKARVARLNPGETLYRDMISSAAINVAPDKIVSCNVVSPAANLVPTATQVIRIGTVNHV